MKKFATLIILTIILSIPAWGQTNKLVQCGTEIFNGGSIAVAASRYSKNTCLIVAVKANPGVDSVAFNTTDEQERILIALCDKLPSILYELPKKSKFEKFEQIATMKLEDETLLLISTIEGTNGKWIGWNFRDKYGVNKIDIRMTSDDLRRFGKLLKLGKEQRSKI